MAGNDHDHVGKWQSPKGFLSFCLASFYAVEQSLVCNIASMKCEDN